MTADVAVIGAGPTGLMLAGELSLRGGRPIVLERRTGPSELPKANGIVGLVVRMFEVRGLLDRLRAESRHNHGWSTFSPSGPPSSTSRSAVATRYARWLRTRTA